MVEKNNPSESKKLSTATRIWIIIIAVTAIDLSGIFGYYGRSSIEGWGVCVSASAGLALCIFYAVVTKGRRQIAAIVGGYLWLILIGGCIHFFLFRYSTQSAAQYSFSESIGQGRKYTNDINPILDEVFKTTDSLRWLALIDAEQEKIIECHKNIPIFFNGKDSYFGDPPETSQRGFVHLRDGSTRIRLIIIASGVADVASSATFLEVRNGATRHLYDAQSIDRAIQDDQLLTPKEVNISLREMVESAKREQTEKQNSLQYIAQQSEDWKFIDFCYFSTITMTTVGYGDIIPNSRTVRVVVMLQSIIGVIYIGFALTLIKINPRRIRRGFSKRSNNTKNLNT